METPRPKQFANDEQRFWSKVDRRGPDECWPWLGTMPGCGYGSFRIGRSRRQATHIAWTLKNGIAFPRGKVACHTCDNPRCVNPAHLWAGTNQENRDDCVAKGRSRTRWS